VGPRQLQHRERRVVGHVRDTFVPPISKTAFK
jgi:hypothetical protein